MRLIFELAMLADLRPVLRWVEIKPTPRDEQFQQWMEYDREQRRQLAAEFAIPPELLSGTVYGVNMNSARALLGWK